MIIEKFKRPSPTGEYNILTNHLHFNKNGVEAIMPSGTKYVAILRDPADLFYSIFTYYYNNVHAFQRSPGDKMPGRMRAFLDNPHKYYGK